MPAKPNDHPGSGLDKAPDKSLTEKISDTVKAIIKPIKNANAGSDDTQKNSAK